MAEKCGREGCRCSLEEYGHSAGYYKDCAEGKRLEERARKEKIAKARRTAKLMSETRRAKRKGGENGEGQSIQI